MELTLSGLTRSEYNRAYLNVLGSLFFGTWGRAALYSPVTVQTLGLLGGANLLFRVGAIVSASQGFLQMVSYLNKIRNMDIRVDDVPGTFATSGGLFSTKLGSTPGSLVFGYLGIAADLYTLSNTK